MRLCGWTAVLPLLSGELMVARGCCEGSLKPSIPEHMAWHLATSHNCYCSYFIACSIALPTDDGKTACPALHGPRLLCFLSCWFVLFFFLCFQTITISSSSSPHVNLLAVIFWRLGGCGRSSRRCGCQLMGELDPGTQRLLTPSPVLRMWVPLAFSTPRGCSKDVALRW